MLWPELMDHDRLIQLGPSLLFHLVKPFATSLDQSYILENFFMEEDFQSIMVVAGVGLSPNEVFKQNVIKWLKIKVYSC